MQIHTVISERATFINSDSINPQSMLMARECALSTGANTLARQVQKRHRKMTEWAQYSNLKPTIT